MNIPNHTAKYLDGTSLRKFWKTMDAEFVGYIWMSNAPLKHILTTPKKLPSWEEIHQEHNFVWEAFLYQKDKLSVSIRQVDSRWLVSQVEWHDSPQNAPGEFIDHKYLACGLLQEKKLLLKEAWMPEKDEQCENMEVLVPAWTAFVGFC